VQTVRHFFPDLNDWLTDLPDTRAQDAIEYDRRFLAWWGIALYLFQLGSRRQLDFDLDVADTRVLDNLNRLARTRQTTRPVHDTLDHFLDHVAAAAFARLRLQMVRRLLRMKILDDARLLGHLVIVVDGTGLLCFHRRHCDHCLVQKHATTTLYLHNVLEAKLLGPAGVVLSVGSEFIENADADQARGKGAEQVKQDCELKAFSRLAPQLKTDFPQACIVLAGDSLFACGRVLDECLRNNWQFVLTFKEGHLPALWQEYESLLPLCPDQRLERAETDGTRRRYRWVRDLSYQDSDRRRWQLNALECLETTADGATTTRFVWLTGLPVNVKTVEEIAWKGGRYRWKIENEGFNRQKNSGLNLKHVYSTDPEKWKAYYYLLQIAFIIVQLLERGSLLRRLAEQHGKRTTVALFGSLKNIARRLLESVRQRLWPESSYDAAQAAAIHISLEDTS
jgi:hypothetical protein